MAPSAVSGRYSAKRYCNVAIPHTRLRELTYEFELDRFPELTPGACLEVRLRGRRVKGLALEVLPASPVPHTLPVEKLIESRLVDDHLLSLLRWVSAYYFGRMGEVLGLALPRGICGYGLRRRARGGGEAPAQPAVVSDLRPPASVFPPAFSVYVQSGAERGDLVADFVRQGLGRGSVIVLSPESEVGAWSGELRSRFATEPVVYGGRKQSERKRVWRELRTTKNRLVLGVRSAVFAPVSDLSGVVVLGEHESVFKEERHPRINARDVAIARCKLAACPALLCDSTPSAETWLNLKTGQYQGVDNGPGQAGATDTIVVDMRKHRDEVLAPVLVNELKEAYTAGESALLYINRRGFSRYVVCRDCGTPLSCPSCAVAFCLYASGRLVCRYCGRTSAAPDACPTCNSADFRFRVPGIELAEREVRRLEPEAKVVTVEANRQSPIDEPLAPGSVIVGTRSLFGLAWPERVKVVAALSVDADLCLPDFRARERTFQVLCELSRRAGRCGATLVLQTRRPDDTALQCAITGDVVRFFELELKLREECGFPPYRRLALVELNAPSAARAVQRGEWLCRRLNAARGIEALGPVAVRGKANTVQVMVKVARDRRLDRLVTLTELEAGGVRAKVDVDPLETL